MKKSKVLLLAFHMTFPEFVVVCGMTVVVLSKVHVKEDKIAEMQCSCLSACARARVSISLQAESLATLSYEVAAVASISKLELSGAISATLSAIDVGSLDLAG